MLMVSQVQSGGSFDIDYAVFGPDDKIIMEAAKERQLDSVFTAKQSGEYRFCFNNEMSTFADKLVDFEIAVRKRHFYMPIQHRTWPCQHVTGVFARAHLGVI